MSIITLFIIGTTVLASVMAFSNHRLFDEMAFYPYRMWRNNEWHRLITNGFIHADIGHLFFNMFALFSFGPFVNDAFDQVFEGKGTLIYVLMYFIAIVIADAYNLFAKKNDPNYRSIGASGGISAVIFAFILLSPFSKIGIIFLPIGVPAYIFGGLYLFYCAYMARRGGDNIGHMAHFTGSIFGFFMPVILEPQLLTRFIDKISNGG